MTRFVTFALAIPLLLTDACNVTENENGSSTISLDENRIEQGAELVANEASEAREKAANALENAGPIIENSASDIEERAGRVADKVENVDVDVDLNTADDKPRAK